MPPTLEGRPATLNRTRPENPLMAETVTLNVPMPSLLAVRLDGEAEMVKSARPGAMVRVTDVECAADAPVPVIVRV